MLFKAGMIIILTTLMASAVAAPSNKKAPFKSKVLGGGHCVLYPSDHPTCANGCGPGPDCKSTWKYFGKGQSGGCAEGKMVNTSMSPAGVTQFECIPE